MPLAVALLLLAQAPALSSGSGGPATGWFLFEVSGPDLGRLSLNITAEGSVSIYAAAYDGTDLVKQGATHYVGKDASVVVETEAEGTRADLSLTTAQAFGTGYTLRDEGSANVLFFIAGDVASWSGGSSEVRKRRCSAPASCKRSRAKRWRAATGSTRRLAASARARGRGRSLDIRVEHTLVGWFARNPEPYSAHAGATLTGPAGQQHCPCVLLEGDGPDAAGPGRYRFAWTGAGATAAQTPAIAWADIPFAALVEPR